MAASKLYDTIIIGGGPAGLSTALGLGRQARTCLVISHKRFRNDGIEASHAVLGHDHIPPQTTWALAREQIKRYDNTTFAEGEIVSAKRTPQEKWHGHQGFVVTSKEGQSWQGKTLVLATGVKDMFPDLEGYQENWPRNIYQCLFCDGWERRESQKAVLCLPNLGPPDMTVALMALSQNKTSNADGSGKVTILSNGKSIDDLDEAVAKRLKALGAVGIKVDERKVLKLEAAGSGEQGVYVHLQDPNSNAVEKVLFGYIMHKPPTALNAQGLIEELGLEVGPGMFGEVVKTTGFLQATNVPGAFVAGDSGNVMTHVTTAMSSGIGAAGGAVNYLNELDLEDARI